MDIPIRSLEQFKLSVSHRVGENDEMDIGFGFG